MNSKWIIRWGPISLGVLALVFLAGWWLRGPDLDLARRVPGTDMAGATAAPGKVENPVLAGAVVSGSAQPGQSIADWPQFRGPNRTGASPDPMPLNRDAGQWKKLWSVEVGEGYAGPILANGRVYLMDYDREAKQDAFRCLSLADGGEIWRYAYPLSVKRNHGMSRTVPSLASNRVVAIGPLCHVLALDAQSGTLLWSKDLVQEFGTKVPPWYAGQCPLIDEGTVVLAPAGKEVLLTRVDLETGEPQWESANPNGWKMTHSSIMSMTYGGHRMYVYCASGGVVGVSADDGAILWSTPEWKISMATVPSPVVLDDGRLFLSGGYGAGSLMLKLNQTAEGSLEPEVLFRLEPRTFGVTQQTPILRDDHVFGVREDDGQFVCLDLEGQVVWESGPDHTFGLGAFLIADDLILALDDPGLLTVFDASAERFNPHSQAQLLQGREAWGPMAIGDGRILVRDLTEMTCWDAAAR